MLDFQLLLTAYPLLFAILLCFIGASIGSFINVVVYRLPIMLEQAWNIECGNLVPDDGENTQPFNLAVPASACPKCRVKIEPWHNIPIISWILLRGKCAYCQSKISMRYPLVELSTGLLTVFIVFTYGLTPLALLLCIVTWWLIPLILIDADTYLLPDQLTLSLLWIALLASTLGVGITPSAAIIGAVVGYLSLWSIYWIFKLLTGKEGMGFGDFKLLAALGALVGVSQLLTIIVLASITGLIYGLISLKQQSKSSRGASTELSAAIPFGPFLAIAGWITLIWGKQLNSLYWQWVLGA